jgi:2-succinyl-6-hydroxy-2,4-cyclohexadiene-1-carboxylate synthase
VRVRGLDLHVEVDGSGPPLLLLHGFTNSIASWDLVRSDLAKAFRLILVDLIGHGQSEAPADPSRYTSEHALMDLLAVLDALDLQRVALLGYSMGGRLALHLALAAPRRFARLILESASPGIADDGARQERAATDNALAERIERDGVDAFVEYWENLPLLALGGHVPEAIKLELHGVRLRNQPIGLANSLRGMGAGRLLPVWSRLAALALPTLLIAGARDQRYVEIAQRMHHLLPHSTLLIAPDAGHTAHLDQPAWFINAVCHS